MKMSVQKQANKVSKKRIFNVLELVLQLVLLCILFCCPSHLCNNCGFRMKFFDHMYLSGVIALLFMIINVILCTISIVKNTTAKDSTWHVVVPIISSINLLLGLIQDNCCGNGELSSAMFICLILGIILVFMGFIKKSNFVVPKEPVVAQVTINSNSTSADELKKYKDLLDSGAITQEEFEQKKKELLGL